MHHARAARPGLAGLVLGLALCGASLAGCGGSSRTTTRTTPPPATTTTVTTPPASGSRTVTATSDGVTATMRAGTHTPTVEVPWPVHFTVTRAGAPAAASVSYEYLFGGQVVARRSHYTFHGQFSDTFHWPASAVGYPLTFRAVIVSGTTQLYLEYTVQVHR